MYSKVIENEIILQKLNEENEKLKRQLEEMEKSEEESKYNFPKENYEKNGGLRVVNDLDIFKKLQAQMNKKSEVLEQTLNKYKIKAVDGDPSSSFVSKPKNHFTEENKQSDMAESAFAKKEEIPFENIQYTNEENENDNFTIPEEKSYESLIFKIPSILLDNKIEEIEIYIRLEMQYSKLTTIASKINFISLLRQVLNNVVMLKHASFPVYLQLFNFILSMQSNELFETQKGDSLPCANMQELSEFLLTNKEITQMLRIILVLIRRYFPQNLSMHVEDRNIIILKLLLLHLSKLNEVSRTAFVNMKEVIVEINDFLFAYPPSYLSKDLPLFNLYYKIYGEIRKITDNFIQKRNKKEIINAISFLKSKNDLSEEYIKYLEYTLYKF